jgi:hypothetical protein
MVSWIRNKFKIKPRVPKGYKSPYENSLGFTIWKNNDGNKSCSEGHIFLEDIEYSDEEKELEIVSYVYKVCMEDGQTIEEIYKQIRFNLVINNLWKEKNLFDNTSF